MFFDLQFWHSRRLLCYRPSSLTLQLTCSKVGEYPKPQYTILRGSPISQSIWCEENLYQTRAVSEFPINPIPPQKNWELCYKAFGPTLCHKSYIFLSIPKPAKSRFWASCVFCYPTRVVFFFWCPGQDISYIPSASSLSSRTSRCSMP